MSRFTPEPFADDDELREYRLTRTRFSELTPIVVLLLVLQLGQLFMLATDVPMRIIVTVLVAVPLVLIVWYSLVSATHTDQDGLTVHGWFRARKTPWTRIQNIVVEPKLHRQLKSAPYFVTAVYDDTGRRTVLPNLNDRNGLDLDHETEILRRIWRARRGPAWQSADVRQSHTPPRLAPWQAALAVAVFTSAAALAVLVFLAVQLADGTESSSVDSPVFVQVIVLVMLVFGPGAIAFFVTLYVTRARRVAEASIPPRPRTEN
ncbi:hypothetical protein [Amycolatopsis samaneae]|uniref:PH domain-containing protein n=1 Tax=Amycolatopsis samaneae TaxID=664691 RepID=A0ABW5G957_9PSEU